MKTMDDSKKKMIGTLTASAGETETQNSAGFMPASNPAPRSVVVNDELLPRVAPNVSLYGFFSYVEENGYHAHESIAYDSLRKQLLFGVANSYAEKSEAYLYVTDMNLKQQRLYKVPNAYSIIDMAFAYDGKLMIAPRDPNKVPFIRIYSYPNFNSWVDINLSSDFSGTYIDALCYSSELNMNIVKGGSKIVFYNYNFTSKQKEIIINTSDLHGDPITSQAMEYYNGHILALNGGNWGIMGSTKNAYLNVYRMDGSKVETYRYPDSTVNMSAQGICKLGNGKYLFTHYGGPRIEVRTLDFNTPSHTHTLSDIMDWSNPGTVSKALYVNPQLESGSYLAPDGSAEKPFPSVSEAVAYAKLFHSEAIVHLMEGNYGTVHLSNIRMNLTFKGTSKDTCLIDKINICKCSGLSFENITFCDGERPFEVTSSTIEINNCSFPNGKQSAPEAAETYGINILKTSVVTLKDCEINHFGAAVNISKSKLFIEGNQALKGTGNKCGIRGEKSMIQGTKGLSGKAFTPQALSLNECQCDGDSAAVSQTNGATRPSDPGKGQFYFDIEANKPLWWNGSVWVDTAGKVY